jgi:hypothetical protein
MKPLSGRAAAASRVLCKVGALTLWEPPNEGTADDTNIGSSASGGGARGSGSTVTSSTARLVMPPVAGVELFGPSAAIRVLRCTEGAGWASLSRAEADALLEWFETSDLSPDDVEGLRHLPLFEIEPEAGGAPLPSSPTRTRSTDGIHHGEQTQGDSTAVDGGGASVRAEEERERQPPTRVALAGVQHPRSLPDGFARSDVPHGSEVFFASKEHVAPRL